MRRWLGVAVFLSLVLDAGTKGPGNLSEMLWACHWASALIGLGILAGSRSAVCAGLLFHLTLGIPAWLLGLMLTAELHPTSVLVHSFPALSAALYLKGLRVLPRHLAVRAWLLHPAALLASMLYAPPDLNVNMVSEPWPPIAHLFPNLAFFHVAEVSLSLMMLLLMERAARRWLTGKTGRIPVSAFPGGKRRTATRFQRAA